MPALVNLLITLPAGQWIASRRLTSIVFNASIANRLLYPLLIPIALLLTPSAQIDAILLLIALTSIPGAVLAIAFNAMFADAVPNAWRGEVVGRRNAILALTMLISSLLSGLILRTLPFEQGYIAVFAIGAAGAAFSSYHLWRIRLPETQSQRVMRGDTIGDAGRISRVMMGPDMPLQRPFAIRMLTRVPSPNLRSMVSPLRTSFGPFLFALFAFHLTQYIPIPLFPLYWVRELELNDATISILNATFYTVMFGASLRLGALTKRFGNRKLTIAGAFLLALYPLLTALSQNIALIVIASIVGGAVWGILGGSLANRLLERVPEDDKPRHLALYNLALNIAILAGTFIGIAIAGALDLQIALFIAFGLRIVAGFILFVWG